MCKARLRSVRYTAIVTTANKPYEPCAWDRGVHTKNSETAGTTPDCLEHGQHTSRVCVNGLALEPLLSGSRVELASIIEWRADRDPQVTAGGMAVLALGGDLFRSGSCRRTVFPTHQGQPYYRVPFLQAPLITEVEPHFML